MQVLAISEKLKRGQINSDSTWLLEHTWMIPIEVTDMFCKK
jgi:hypothetical protein